MQNRLDKELVERNLVCSRTKAEDLIKNGYVKVKGKITTKPGLKIKNTEEIEILENNTTKYVSRAGLKLEKALHVFNIDMKDKKVLDIGSSTGGFTDCCLKHGAKKVYAVDVGTNVMVEKLRTNPKVELHEQTNIKDLSSDIFHDIEIITVDVSFISLEKIIEKISSYNIKVDIICLIKPQFECGKEQAKKYKGVILNKKIHQQILQKIIHQMNQAKYYLKGISSSPIRGKDGNIEYISYFTNQNKTENEKVKIEKLVNETFKNKEAKDSKTKNE